MPNVVDRGDLGLCVGEMCGGCYQRFFYYQITSLDARHGIYFRSGAYDDWYRNHVIPCCAQKDMQPHMRASRAFVLHYLRALKDYYWGKQPGQLCSVVDMNLIRKVA